MADLHVLFKDTAFGPERLKEMGEAFDLVKRVMPALEPTVIAEAIIEAAMRGVEDAPTLAALAMEALDGKDRTPPA